MFKSISAILFLSIVGVDSSFSMNTGYFSPGTRANDSSVGSVAWTNVNYSSASDNYRAITNLISNQSNYIKVTNFGFDLSTGAIVITGITVRKEYNNGPAHGCITDVTASLIVGGTIQGANNADTVNCHNNTVGQEPTNLAYYGSSTTWSLSLVADQINDSDFGFAYTVQETDGADTDERIDQLAIDIEYEEISGATLTMD